MLTRSGLYYPHIEIRNETWLKGAALYWKRMDRIVPSQYPTHDSRTLTVLRDEIDFIHDRRPDPAVGEASHLFIEFLEDRGAELARVLGSQENDRFSPQDRKWTAWPPGHDAAESGYILPSKLGATLVRELEHHGLASTVAEAPGRPRGTVWVGMDARLAATYMAVLAQIVARRFHLSPVTDNPYAHAALGSLSVDTIADALMNQPIALAPAGAGGDLGQRVAMLAIQTVLPQRLADIDPERIAAFRKAHEDELTAFQGAVEGAAADLAQLPIEIDAGELRDRVIEATRQHLLKPREDLKRSMSLAGLQPVSNVLTMGLPLGVHAAATAIGNATAPIYGFATIAAAAVVTFTHLEKNRRHSLRADSQSANYLLQLESHFTSQSVQSWFPGIRR